MDFVLETERLFLRELSVKDAESFYLLNLDPEVMRYTGDKAFKSIGEAELFLAQYDQYAKHGYGRWAVIEKNSRAFLGWCGLRYTVKLNETDIGFRFFKQHWNKGFATEAARACIDFGFAKYGLKVIVGNVMKENLASIRVLEKAGLRFLKERECGEEEGLVYRIKSDEFLNC